MLNFFSMFLQNLTENRVATRREHNSLFIVKIFNKKAMNFLDIYELDDEKKEYNVSHKHLYTCLLLTI